MKTDENKIMHESTKCQLPDDIIDILCGYNYPNYLPPGIYTWMKHNVIVFISLGNKCFLTEIQSIDGNFCRLIKKSEPKSDYPDIIDLKIVSPVPFPHPGNKSEINSTYTKEYCQWVINNNKLAQFVYIDHDYIMLEAICYKLVRFLLKQIVYNDNLMSKLQLQFADLPMSLRGLITHFTIASHVSVCGTEYKYLPQFIFHGFIFTEEDIAWAYAEEEKNCINIIFRKPDESIDDKVNQFIREVSRIYTQMN